MPPQTLIRYLLELPRLAVAYGAPVRVRRPRTVKPHRSPTGEVRAIREQG